MHVNGSEFLSGVLQGSPIRSTSSGKFMLRKGQETHQKSIHPSSYYKPIQPISHKGRAHSDGWSTTVNNSMRKLSDDYLIVFVGRHLHPCA